MERKQVWIYESGAMKLLEKVGEGASTAYIFEGLAADFERNENGRVYSKDDYVSHFSYLTPKIKEGALWGELDHPERYNVLVKEASHIIKDLYYDKDTNTVKIKIELFDNKHGEQVKGMVDKGAPVYISSRASGFIDESGNVVLEKIYTYDIVNEPGFKNAKLTRLNESLGIEKSSNIEIYEMKTINTEENKDKSNSMSTNTGADGKKPLSIEEAFQEYTTNTGKLFEKMQTGMDEMRELIVKKNPGSETTNEDVAVLKQLDEVKKNFNTAMDQFETYTTEFDGYKGKVDESHRLLSEMKNSVNGLLKWAVASEKKHTNTEAMHKRIVEHINDVANIMNENITEVSEFKTKISSHVNLIINTVNENMEEVEGSVTKLKEYHNLAAESIHEVQEVLENKVVTHLNTVTESVNELLSDTEKSNKKVEDIATHVNVVSTIANENLVTNAEFGIEEITGSVDEGFTADITVDNEPCGKMTFDKKGYSVAVGESFSQVADQIKNSTKLKKVFEATYFQAYGVAFDLVESIKQNNPDHISKLVDQAIASAKNKNASKQSATNESKFPFLKVIASEMKLKFLNLSEAKQARVAQVIEDKTLLRSAEIENAISVVENMGDSMLKFTNHLTGDQIKLWENLDEDRKDMVYSMFDIRNINDKLSFDAFFESLDWRVKVTEPLSHKGNNVSENLQTDDDDYADKMLRLK